MKKFNFAIAALVTSLTLSALTGGQVEPTDTQLGKIHTSLLKLAKQTPYEWVEVIVQKISTDTAPETKVAQLGGTVTQDLSIIRGFAARLPAQAAISLTKLPEVRWVSPDPPVQKPAEPVEVTSTANLVNAYIREIKADTLWARGLQGQAPTKCRP